MEKGEEVWKDKGEAGGGTETATDKDEEGQKGDGEHGGDGVADPAYM